jgi:hypothetical protein
MLEVHTLAVVCFCTFSASAAALHRLCVVVYIIGPLTSMWNHGTASAAARWTDRAAMKVGLGIDAWLWG